MSRKTHRFGHAEDIIREYPENVKLLAERKAEIIGATQNKPEVLISGKGRSGDPTANKGLKLAQDPQITYLKDSVQSVECALQDFETDPRYPQLHKIIDLYYWKQTHTVLGAGLAVGYEKTQAGTLKNRFVRRVMAYLGW